jgi:uncharacterized membrane protein
VGLLAIILLFVTPVVALVALSRTRRLESEIRDLRDRLTIVEGRFEGERHARPAPVAAPRDEPMIASAGPPENAAPPAPAFTEAPSWRPVSVPKIEPDASMKLERLLTERWLVWLGGLALVLGGAFLVKFSVDQELLGPGARVSLGGLLGLGVIALGHWLSRRPIPVSALPWLVPPVLVGAGASIIFASLFAAYGLYGLIAAPTAFAALALTAAGTVLLSLGHGPFVALLGLAGAFAVPLLVRASEPSALGLFAYLLVVSAGALALLRWRQWPWLAWVVLGATAGWVLLWTLTWHPDDELVLGPFLCLLFGLFAAFRLGIPGIALFAGPIDSPLVWKIVMAAGATLSFLALIVAGSADHSEPALAACFVLVLGFIAMARHDQAFDRLPWIGAALALLVLVGWDVGLPLVPELRDILARPLPGESGRFAATALAFAGLFGAAGFLGMPRARHPWRWASVAAAAPVAILAVAYWRLSSLGDLWAWVMAALVLAALLVAAAERTGRHRLAGQKSAMDGALAAFAIGVIGALALAATFALEEAWLTVALALLPAGIAWVERRLGLAALRKVALLLAVIVLVRLGLNPQILSYPIGTPGVFNWLLYGYGIPCVAFAVAARLFRRDRDDPLVLTLEAGTIVFAALLAGLEIRHLMAGGLSPAAGYSLAERSLHTLCWLGGAAILFQLHARRKRMVHLKGGLALLLLGTLQAVWLQAGFGNPLLSGDAVGDTPVFNQLLISFAAPAALFALNARLAPSTPREIRVGCAALALVFGFLWATLETRHAFVGGSLRLGVVTQAEMWAYSGLYLAGGIAILVGAMRGGSVLLRRTGLAIVLLAVVQGLPDRPVANIRHLAGAIFPGTGRRAGRHRLAVPAVRARRGKPAIGEF